MKAQTITYVIGTEDIGIGEDEIQDVEAYQIEVHERLHAAFPGAQHIDVVIDNGCSRARIEGLEIDDYGTREKALERIQQIADEVWNHGEWHSARCSTLA